MTGWIVLLAGVIFAASWWLSANETHRGVPDETVVPQAEDTGLKCKGCNLVLLNVELLRADHVGLLFGNSALTPNIDRFFGNGIQFRDASSASGATYLSATATATGTEAEFNRHSLWKLGRRGGGGAWKLAVVVQEDGPLLVDRMPTIAQVLQSSGYSTHGINDWIHSGERVFLDRGFEQYLRLHEYGALFETQVDQVVDVMESIGQAPFLLYFHTNALHFNFYFPRERQAEVASRLSMEIDLASGVFSETDDAIVVNGRHVDTPLDAAWEAYAMQVQLVDAEMERIFQALASLDPARTIVVLYAHHGLTTRRTGRMSVGTPYPENIRVPLLIRHPRVDGPIIVDRMASLVDLAPTLADMLDIPWPVPLTSTSMTPLIAGDEYARKYAYSRDLQYESVRDADFQLIYKGGVAEQLVDLRASWQGKNIPFDPADPRVKRLMQQFTLLKTSQNQYHSEMSALLRPTEQVDTPPNNHAE